MTAFMKEYLNQFNNKTPKVPQHQPYPEPEMTYSADSQKMKPINTSPELSTERAKQIGRIIRKFFYYAMVAYNTCLLQLITMVTRSDPK